MRELIPRFSLEQEEAAYAEVKRIFIDEWAGDAVLFDGLYHDSLQILEEIKRNNVAILPAPYYSADKETLALIHHIYADLIFQEPILYRIFIHNQSPPNEIVLREWLRDYFIRDISAYQDIVISLNIFKGSDLARQFKAGIGGSLGSIPARWFLVGKILKNLLSDYNHFRMIDIVFRKLDDYDDDIEFLRNNRIYTSEEGTVYDYSPLFKKTYGTKSIIIEFFNEKDFKRRYDWTADDALCALIQSGDRDSREEIFFGSDPNSSEYEFVIKYKDKSKSIPFQLWPKYKNDLPPKYRCRC